MSLQQKFNKVVDVLEHEAGVRSCKINTRSALHDRVYLDVKVNGKLYASLEVVTTDDVDFVNWLLGVECTTH